MLTPEPILGEPADICSLASANRPDTIFFLIAPQPHNSVMSQPRRATLCCQPLISGRFTSWKAWASVRDGDDECAWKAKQAGLYLISCSGDTTRERVWEVFRVAQTLKPKTCDNRCSHTFHATCPPSLTSYRCALPERENSKTSFLLLFLSRFNCLPHAKCGGLRTAAARRWASAPRPTVKNSATVRKGCGDESAAQLARSFVRSRSRWLCVYWSEFPTRTVRGALRSPPT